MGRMEENNYPEGYEGDYYIITDAMDEAFEKYMVEDDIAEPAIYSETVEKVARFVEAVTASVKATMEETKVCPLCWDTTGEHTLVSESSPGCPMMILWQLVEPED